MTLLDDRPSDAVAALVDDDVLLAPVDPDDDAGDEAPPSNPFLVSASAALSAAAAGWTAGGVFTGWLPRLVGVAAALLGAGIVALSYRMRRPTPLQYLAVPLCAVFGALLALPAAEGGADLVQLVREALFAGGLGQPPVAFVPGWRFLLVVLAGGIGAAAASMAIGLDQPKLAVALPVAPLFGAFLLQPAESEIVTAIVAFALVAAAFIVGYGVELARDGVASGGFEARRLVRGFGVLLALVAALGGVAQLGFLFPPEKQTSIVPPRRPEPPPVVGDAPVLEVTSPSLMPWRLGTLDVYQDNAWMTPPYDTSRFRAVDDGRQIERTEDDTSFPLEAGETVEVTYRVLNLPGEAVPTLGNVVSVEGSRQDLQYDPRTQVVRVTDGRARSGLMYTVTAARYPTGDELAEAGPPREELDEFLEVPGPPPEVQALLQQSQAAGDTLFDRMQFVRRAFYAKVIASGGGRPVDVPPDRVADMLAGGRATPYEITAAEALLVRWSGVPARIGFGYYGGEQQTDGTYLVTPKEGSTWLEAYFEGHGWVPIIGRPQQADSSLSQSQNSDPSIEATDELRLNLWVPVKLDTFTVAYVVARYWAVRTLPFVLLVGALVAFYPAALRVVRRVRRRRWAAAHGPRAQLLVAYAELRDTANDLNIGHPTLTPLEWLQTVDADDEHAELAWLVTRGVWGDLARDLRDEDVDAARELASSVNRRIRGPQGALSRLLAAASRASLREPWCDDVPNAWYRLQLARRLRSAVGAVLSLPGRAAGAARARVLRPATSTLVLVLAVMTTLTGCVQQVQLSAADAQSVLPATLVPDTVKGFSFRPEPEIEQTYNSVDDSLMALGRIWSVRDGETVQGSLQVGVFKDGLREREDELRKGVLKSIGSGNWELTRLGKERIYVSRVAGQALKLWFSPTTQYYELLVTPEAFGPASDLFASVLQYQRTGRLDAEAELPPGLPDPRRGEDL